MSNYIEPWHLRRPVFVLGSFLLAGMFGYLAYSLFKSINKLAEFQTNLGELALQISLLVLAGAAIKELIEWRTTSKMEYTRNRELRAEFLRRIREVNVKVVYSRDIMLAHNSAKSWSKQSRNLMLQIAELGEIYEDLKASPNLFKQQENILNGIDGMRNYLNRCRDEYKTKRIHFDADLNRGGGRIFNQTILEQDMTWTRDFMNGNETFETEYTAHLLMAKKPMRQAVFGNEAANMT